MHCKQALRGALASVKYQNTDAIGLPIVLIPPKGMENNIKYAKVYFSSFEYKETEGIL